MNLRTTVVGVLAVSGVGVAVAAIVVSSMTMLPAGGEATPASASPVGASTAGATPTPSASSPEVAPIDSASPASSGSPAGSARSGTVPDLTASTRLPVDEEGRPGSGTLFVVSSCMAERGFSWTTELARETANAELAAVARSLEAGSLFLSAETAVAETRAGAQSLGLADDAYERYRVALVGVPGAIDESCTWRASQGAGTVPTAADTAAYDGALAFCLSVPGATMNGHSGTGEGYRWEQAGCAGYATHVTGNDHNN